MSIPPKHVMNVPGPILVWKAPRLARQHERFINNEEQIAQDAQKYRRSSFRITALLYIWGTLFMANTGQYSTMNKQQLPDIERGATFIFKYQVLNSESESQVRLFPHFPTLPGVNIDGVHDIRFESNQKLSRIQYRIAQAGCNNITFNESYVPVTQ